MADDFPQIEPTTFDTIVIGTGLQESILAAAAASAGHSVLHLDPCPFYGLHWTSLSLDDFTAWAASGGRLPVALPSLTQIDGSGKPIKAPDGEDLELEPVTNRVLYSDFELSNPGSEPLGPSRDFNLDIAGPKLAFCGGPLVDLLLKAGASNYLEFKCVEASYIWSGAQGLMPVPDSRASIFQDRTLSLVEKKHLMRFFKLVQNHGGAGELSSEVLESRFVDFLDQQKLPSSIKSIILYAIALADHDQEHESREPNTVLKTKDGIDSLVLYLSSIGRLEFPCLNDLVYVHYNLRLCMRQMERTPDVDSISLHNIDVLSHWNVEIENPVMEEAPTWLEEEQHQEEQEEEQEEEEQDSEEEDSEEE